jgi:hypothetical protein
MCCGAAVAVAAAGDGGCGDGVDGSTEAILMMIMMMRVYSGCC